MAKNSFPCSLTLSLIFFFQKSCFITDREKNKVVVSLDCKYKVKKTQKEYEVKETHIFSVNKSFVIQKLEILFDFTPVLDAWVM